MIQSNDGHCAMGQSLDEVEHTPKKLKREDVHLYGEVTTGKEGYSNAVHD